MAVLRVQCPCTDIDKTEKIINTNQNDGAYQIAADGMLGGWSCDQFARIVKKS